MSTEAEIRGAIRAIENNKGYGTAHEIIVENIIEEGDTIEWIVNHWVADMSLPDMKERLEAMLELKNLLENNKLGGIIK